MAAKLAEGEQEQEETTKEKQLPKIHLTPEELLKYESGLIIFKIIDCDVTRSNVHVEVVVDDMAFPSYSSSTIKTKKMTLDEIGDCFCLNNPTILKLRDEEGHTNNIKVSLKYIPVKMELDPSESINNMGKLRVDVLDAADLPSADRNGYSDPYCKFEFNGNSVFKTKVQKKTLHPAWNEFFELDGSSTFSGTFATPGKIVTGVAGAPIKGVGFAAHGVGKGASFIRHGFKSKKKDEDELNGSAVTELENDVPVTNSTGGLRRAGGLPGSGPPIPEINPPVTPPEPHHGRTKSFGAASGHSGMFGSPGTTCGPVGIANFTIVSASGFPPSSSVMVYVKTLGGKPKVIHKTDHIKSPTGTVIFNEKKESFKCTTSADATFQVSVKAHNTFGSDDDLGEGVLVVDETGTMQEKQVRCGAGYIMVKSNFIMSSTENGSESPKARTSFGRSLLSKKEPGRTSRDITHPLVHTALDRI
ncbi:hypothetical protein DID88_004962 [Monilinia fructigena]|uniref:C2 domain-containing protein n=1 Tax=Monilinia fructigena TaxID=38457 RepID=A0A395IQQ4_9HELO|nr:hypothetical protein DID88_004962 [Monilinia fructigena]